MLYMMIFLDLDLYIIIDGASSVFAVFEAKDIHTWLENSVSNKRLKIFCDDASLILLHMTTLSQ